MGRRRVALEETLLGVGNQSESVAAVWSAARHLLVDILTARS